MPLILSNSETLSRYLYDKGTYNRPKNRVNWTAFMPRDGHSDISVYRTVGLSEDEIWQIAEIEVSPTRTPSLKGRADINVEDIPQPPLQLIVDEPPYRHKNIANWPMDKDVQMSIALGMSKTSNLVMK